MCNVCRATGNMTGLPSSPEAGVDHRDPDGNTPLIKAAGNGLCGSVKLLVEAGADRNLFNYDGKTALMLAAGRLHVNILQLLLMKEAHVNLRSHKSQKVRNPDIAKLLFGAGKTSYSQDPILLQRDLIMMVKRL